MAGICPRGMATVPMMRTRLEGSKASPRYFCCLAVSWVTIGGLQAEHHSRLQKTGSWSAVCRQVVPEAQWRTCSIGRGIDSCVPYRTDS